MRFIAADNPGAARKVGAALRAAGDALGRRAIGRPGRVAGTYEKSVIGLPYIVVYALIGGDRLVVLRVIHTLRNWPGGDFSAVGR